MRMKGVGGRRAGRGSMLIAGGGCGSGNILV